MITNYNKRDNKGDQNNNYIKNNDDNDDNRLNVSYRA